METRDRNQQGLFFVGMALLAAANTARFLFQHSHRIGEDVADGVVGFLYGIAIATMLVVVYRRGRAHRSRFRDR